MSPKSESTTTGLATVEPRPFSHCRILTIGGDQPFTFNGPPIHLYSSAFKCSDSRTPMHFHAEPRSFIEKNLVQQRTTDTDAIAARKTRVDCFLIAQESDSAEWETNTRRQFDAQGTQCGEPVRHDALSARFVNRWPRTVGERDRKACSASCDSSRKSCRSSTNDEYF
jgi:hypothetical protein